MTRYGAVDVHYPPSGGARAALVVAADAGLGTIVAARTVVLKNVAPYVPGSFVDRELPALRAVLEGESLDLLVVDSYVTLDAAGRPGLGWHAHEAFGLPVVGVAKTAFRGADHAAEVLRGSSAKPLYVTAAGIPLADAAALVAGMAGAHRIPDALHRVDRLARAV